MKNLIKLLAAVLILALAWFFFPKSEQETVLDFGHDMPVGSPIHDAALYFKTVVEEKTKNKIKIKIHPAQSLGNDAQMTELLRVGKLAFSVNRNGQSFQNIIFNSFFSDP